MKELREARGWSQQRLATRLEELGAVGLDRSVITNLETGRRQSVSIEEALLLALALDVAPVHLIVPFDNDKDVRLSDRVTVKAGSLRAWVRGEGLGLEEPVPGVDEARFRRESPEGVWDERAEEARRLRELEAEYRELSGSMTEVVYEVQTAEPGPMKDMVNERLQRTAGRLDELMEEMQPLRRERDRVRDGYPLTRRWLERPKRGAS